MNKILLALSLLVVVSASCTPAPTPLPWYTLTPDMSWLPSPTATSLPATPSATDAPASAATPAPAIATPVAALRTPTRAPTAGPAVVIRSNPPGMKTWSGGTKPIETANLVLKYPDVIAPADARLHADIAQRAYDAYFVLFGNEHPYNNKISVVWDPKKDGGAVSGNPITMCAKCPNAFTLPMDMGLFHELVHDFTNTGRTRAARYISLNGSMSEAFADYFAYYFKHEVLKYSAEDIAAAAKFRDLELQALSQYEAANTSPYSTAWKPVAAPQFYFSGMMFRVAEQCGWGVWPKFFAAAFSSGNPGIPVNMIDLYPDMTQPAAKKAFADFVGFLDQACGQDLRPMFRKWRFDLP